MKEQIQIEDISTGVVHYYKANRYFRGEGFSREVIFKAACTQKFHKRTVIDKNQWSKINNTNFTSVITNVTCEECIKFLLPQINKQINDLQNLLVKIAP